MNDSQAHNHLTSDPSPPNFEQVTQLKSIQSQWLHAEPWRRWCSTLYQSLSEGRLTATWSSDPSTAPQPPAEEDAGESPAFEVLRFRERDGHFAQSAEVRDPKPPHVLLRVGQVVRHRLWGYHGVVIGWDETARAPEKWLRQMHGQNTGWRQQPNYSVLVDTRDRPAPQVTYVPQENLEVVRQVKILHPSVDEYFEHFDGSQYLPRPWLKGIYPRD